MNIKIIRIDELEAKVAFSGNIVITRDTQLAFEKELSDLINKYAI